EQIVRDYLELRISNFAANQLLAFALTAKRATHSVLPEIEWREQDEWVKLIDYFCDTTYTLFEKRKQCCLSDFSTLTFLGCLYAQVGVLLVHHFVELFPDSGHVKRRLGKRAQITE